jgi:hypothetical protein
LLPAPATEVPFVPELSTTAVIPCRDAALYVGDAVASARAQSRAVVDVIVVDDASTDDSAQVAERAGARCVRLPRSVGAAAARNAGARAARTDLVAFLDADDLWEPHHTTTLVPLLEAAPEAAVAFGHMRTIGSRAGWSLRRPGATGAPFDALVPLLEWNFVPQSAAIVRRAAFWAVGGYGEELERWFVEDYALWLRLAERHPFVGSPEVTMLYRTHAAQASRDVWRMVDATWHVRERFHRELATRDPTQAAVVERGLRRVWLTELRVAWRGGDRVALAARLAAAPLVPDSAAGRRRREWLAAVLGRVLCRGVTRDGECPQPGSSLPPG